MRLRVLTYNIHKGIGGVDRRYDPGRIVEVIRAEAPDVLLLQEVDDGAARSGRDRQVDLLGDHLAMRHRTFFPNVDVRGGGAYGNAILSRYPIIETTNLDLTVPFKKRRSVLHAALRIRHDEVDRTVHIYNMHLGLAGYERARQLQAFLASHPLATLHVDTPIVVGGDLNDVYNSLGGLLTPAGFRPPPIRPNTFPAWGPLRPLDALFVRGAIDLIELSRPDTALARRASDHRPLTAELRLRPPT